MRKQKTITLFFVHAVAASRRAEKQMGPVMVFLDGCVALFPARALAGVPARPRFPPGHLPGTAFLLPEVLPEHQIHFGRAKLTSAKKIKNIFLFWRANGAFTRATSFVTAVSKLNARFSIEKKRVARLNAQIDGLCELKARSHQRLPKCRLK